MSKTIVTREKKLRRKSSHVRKLPPRKKNFQLWKTLTVTVFWTEKSDLCQKSRPEIFDCKSKSYTGSDTNFYEKTRYHTEQVNYTRDTKDTRIMCSTLKGYIHGVIHLREFTTSTWKYNLTRRNIRVYIYTQGKQLISTINNYIATHKVYYLTEVNLNNIFVCITKQSYRINKKYLFDNKIII